MNARRVARELALLTFSQLSKNISKYKDGEIEDIIISSVRTLVNDAENDLKKVSGSLFAMKEYLENYETGHSENLKMPIDMPNIPVPIPLTSDMLGRINTLIDALDKTFTALEMAEISSLANKAEVRDYALKLIQTYSDHKEEVDGQISKLSIGWNIDRLVRIDRDILRLSTVELLYMPEIPISVSIDEAVELAKKYSTEESSSFINGILRQVVQENKLITIKQ